MQTELEKQLKRKSTGLSDNERKKLHEGHGHNLIEPEIEANFLSVTQNLIRKPLEQV